MFDYSTIISERRLTSDDLNGFSLKDSCITKNRLPEFSHVKAGDRVLQITPYEMSHDVADIFAEKEGYIRYEKYGGPAKKVIGTVLFYIVEDDNMNPQNWDVSSLRIEKEVIDGKFYYSLFGMPKEPIADVENVRCSIKVIDDDPLWRIECAVFRGIIFLSGITHHMVHLEAPFRIRLKNGDKSKKGVADKIISNWEDEGDGKHCCIRNFAIGYPKKAQIIKELKGVELPQENAETCFVYIMRNNENEAYKIGISKKPEYREHTLQSQEPNVTCIFQLEFESRDDARAVERDMHSKYAEYHMRGEWFAIPHNIISQVMADIAEQR